MVITEEFGFPDASNQQPCAQEPQRQPDAPGDANVAPAELCEEPVALYVPVGLRGVGKDVDESVIGQVAELPPLASASCAASGRMDAGRTVGRPCAFPGGAMAAAAVLRLS